MKITLFLICLLLSSFNQKSTFESAFLQTFLDKIIMYQQKSELKKDYQQEGYFLLYVPGWDSYVIGFEGLSPATNIDTPSVIEILLTEDNFKVFDLEDSLEISLLLSDRSVSLRKKVISTISPMYALNTYDVSDNEEAKTNVLYLETFGLKGDAIIMTALSTDSTYRFIYTYPIDNSDFSTVNLEVRKSNSFDY